MSVSLRVKADLALVFVSLTWGATFVVIKAALADASPILFVLLRFALASALLMLLFARRARMRPPGLARAGIIIGGFLCAGYLFQTVGLAYTTPTKSAFITALSVVLVPLLLVVVFRQRLRLSAVAGVATATVGLYFLTVPPGTFTVERGDLLTLFCAVAFAGHIVAVGHYAPRYGAGALAVWQVAAAMVFAALVMPVAHTTGLEPAVLTWTPRLIFALVVTAALATALAFSVQTWAQRFTSPTHTALIYSLEPVFAALTSYLVFAERLSSRGLLGAGLILAGVVVAELRAGPAPGVPGAPAPANPNGPDRV